MINFNVMIPTYYYEEGLYNILNSIKNNNFKKNNIKINIFDNTPNKKIYNIYRKKLNKPNYINYYFSKPTISAAENWNKAIIKIENENVVLNYQHKNYFIILHQDEFFCKNFFYNLNKIIKNNNYPDVISCDTFVFYKYKILNKIHTTSWQRKFIYKFFFRYIILRNYIGPTASLIIKLKNKNNKFNLNFKWLLDVDYYLRLYRESNKWIFTSSIFVFSDQSNKYSLTKNYSDKIVFLKKKETKLIINTNKINILVIYKLFDLPLWLFFRIFNKFKFFFNYKKYLAC